MANHKIIKGFFLAFIGLCALCADAQEARVIEENTHIWWSVNANARISDRFGIITDFHLRWQKPIESTQMYLIRAGVLYRLTDRLTLVNGYAHLWLSKSFENNDTHYQDENRIYQQLLWKQTIGRTTIVNRIRNEQRWHEVLNAEGTYSRTRFSNRVRFLFSFGVKLFNNPKWPSLALADEIHFHFGKEIIYNTFNQNRIFAGLKVPVTPSLKFDIGYMMVYLQRYSGNVYSMNHTLRWFFYYTPDWRKK